MAFNEYFSVVAMSFGRFARKAHSAAASADRFLDDAVFA